MIRARRARRLAAFAAASRARSEHDAAIRSGIVDHLNPRNPYASDLARLIAARDSIATAPVRDLYNAWQMTH